MILFVSCIVALYLITLFYSNKQADILSKEKTTPLRGIFAIVVIAHHLSTQVSGLSYFSSWGAPIVSLFLFISGYGAMKSYINKQEKYLHNFINNRIAKYTLIPFISAWLVYKIVFFNTTPGIVESITRLLNNGVVTLPHSWYVYAILLFYAFFYITCKYAKKYTTFILTVLCICYILATAHVGYARCWYISALAFPFGALYAIVETKLLKLWQRSIIYYSTVPLSLALIATLFLLKNEIAYALVYVLIPLIFACIASKIRVEKLNKIKPLLFISSIAYELYLCQGISMQLLRGKYLHIDSDILYIIYTYILTIILACCIKKIATKTNSLFCAKLK